MVTSQQTRNETPPAFQDDDGPRPAGEKPEKKSSLSIPGLLAGAAASATTAVIGGHLSVAGTVLGAAVTSIVSGVAIAFYSSSLEKGRRGLQKVHATAAQRLFARTGRNDATSAEGSSSVADDGSDVSRPRWKAILVSTVVVIALAAAGIFAVQSLTGTELSSGTGQIQRTVTGTDSVAPRGVDTVPSDELVPGTEVSVPAGEQTAPAGGLPADAPTSAEDVPAPEAPAEQELPADGAVPGSDLGGTEGELPGADVPQPGSGQQGAGGGDAGGGAQQAPAPGAAAPAAP